MADEILISTKIDVDYKQAEKELISLQKKLDRLKDKHEITIELRDKAKAKVDSLRKSLTEELAKLESMNWRNATREEIKEQASTVKILSKQFAQARREVASYDKQLEKGSLEIEQQEKKAEGLRQQLVSAPKEEEGDKKKTSFKERAKHLWDIARGSKSAEAGMKRATRSTSEFGRRLRSLVTGAFIFTVISKGLQALKQYLGEVINANAQTSAAFANLKGSILTAIQPILNVVLPIIARVFNAITKMVSFIASVIAAIFGTTINAAADSAAAMQNNMNGAADGLGSANDEAKQLKRTLAGFDELTILENPDDNSGGGGGGGGVSAGAAAFDFDKKLFDLNEFETVKAIAETIAEIFDKIKERTAGIVERVKEWAHNLNFEPLLQAILGLLQSVKGLIDPLFNAIENVLGSFVGPLIQRFIEKWLPKIVEFLGRVIDFIAEIFDWISKLNLEPLLESISGLIESILGLLDPIMSIIESLFEKLIGPLLKKLVEDWLPRIIDVIGEIVDAIGEVLEVLGPVLDTIFEILEPILEILGEILTIVFEATGSAVKGAIKSIKRGLEQISPVLDAIGKVLKPILEVLMPIVQVIGEIFQIITDIVSFIGTGVVDVITGIFTGDWEPLKEDWEELKNTLGEHIQAILDFAVQAWEGIKGIWETVSTWFTENVINPLVEMWNTCTTAIKDFFVKIWEGIKGVWNTVTTWFQNTVINPLVNAWNTATSKIGQFFSNIWEGIKRACATAMNAVIGGLESAINWCVDAINSLISGINWVIQGIGKLFGASWGGIGYVGHVSLGRIGLAEGTVVPPNREFLAMLGDNKYEPEIVSPLSTMKQAMMEAMREAGFSGELTVNTYLDGRKIAENTSKYQMQASRAMGV